MAARDTTVGEGAARVPLPRRAAYGTAPWSADYFVVRHLAEFLGRQLQALCAPGVRVADVGCGEQPLRRLVEDAGARYVGIDVSQNAAGTVAVVAPITALPLADGEFDLVLCTEVLEHVADPLAALGELARIVRPGGKVILTVPFAYPLHEEPWDFGRLTPTQLRRLASACGLDVLHLETAGNEIEVMATVWSSLWSRLAAARPGALTRVAAALLRLPVNAGGHLASRALDRVLPAKYFLNLLSVLQKPAAP
jgi:SAM-dependent methyltransferase